jgi:1,4-dihydroxy-2-naphthoate octaprenyltransferase
VSANPISLFLRLSRPAFLLGPWLTYALGLGIANYLGLSLQTDVALLGMLWVSAMQLSTHYLNEYFDTMADNRNENRTWLSGVSGVLGDGEGQLPRYVALLAAATTLTIVALLTFGLGRLGVLDPLVAGILAVAFLGAFFYSVPPLNLASSGFGELITSALVANLVPALAFSLQAGELHRLLAMATFPLTGLHLAGVLAFEFPDYATDLKFAKRTLLVRLGWQPAMLAHNLLLVVSYALLGLAYVFGLPAAIALPAFITLPLAALQVWYMQRIAQGVKPNWNALTLNAVAIMATTVYLLAYAFWTR